METAIDRLFGIIKSDYRKFMRYTGVNDQPHIVEMVNEFDNKLHYEYGHKYIKIICGDRVWGFIVNITDDKKFAYGDILKAASWQAPARNRARGNIFGEYICYWTGPHYL
jgi:hypothetical protein